MDYITQNSKALYEAREAKRPHSEYDAWDVEYRGYTPAQMAEKAAEIRKAVRAVEKRQAIERRIVRRAVKAFLNAGFAVSVYDGEDYSIRCSTSVKAIMAKVQACDEEWLHVLRKVDGEWKRFGTVCLVYGNGGWDVISDYSVNLEQWLAEVNVYAGSLCE